MPKPKTRKKKPPKRVLALPDLDQAKTPVLNSLTSASGQRTYDHAIREFVAWYCSEPRLAFNRQWLVAASVCRRRNAVTLDLFVQRASRNAQPHRGAFHMSLLFP